MSETKENPEKIRERYEAEVSRPGKFEGCPAYVPYYWDLGLEGLADDDSGRVYAFVVSDEDAVLFPELAYRVGDSVFLLEDDYGFVSETDEEAFDDDDAENDEDEEEEYDSEEEDENENENEDK